LGTIFEIEFVCAKVVNENNEMKNKILNNFILPSLENYLLNNESTSFNNSSILISGFLPNITLTELSACFKL